MTRNVGRTDRAARLALAVVLFVLALVLSGAALRLGLAAVGVVLVGTALTRTCPAYLPFGVSTCEREAA